MKTNVHLLSLLLSFQLKRPTPTKGGAGLLYLKVYFDSH